MLWVAIVIDLDEFTACNQPEALAGGNIYKDCFWPTGDSLHRLNAYPKSDAPGPPPKVSFAVLCPQSARPGFGQKQSFGL